MMGYLDAPNHILANGSFTYQWKASDKSKVEYWYVKSNDFYRLTLTTGRRETFYKDLIPGVTFKNWADVNISLFEYKIDTLFEYWFPDGKNAIAAGTYKMFNNTLNFTTPGGKNYGGSLTATFGDFYGGKRIFISPDVHYNINKHFSIGLTYEYNHIAFDTYLDQFIYAL
ncbi:MAG: hypothetical protein LH473_06950 [Chitinophagales bacterium]|nr:hypothetical protein [Chitinophagales bacterium]